MAGYVIPFEFGLGDRVVSAKSTFAGIVVARWHRLNKLLNWQPHYVVQGDNNQKREFTYFVRSKGHAHAARD